MKEVTSFLVENGDFRERNFQTKQITYIYAFIKITEKKSTLHLYLNRGASHFVVFSITID